MDAGDAQRREEDEDTGLLPMTEDALDGNPDDGDSGMPESELRGIVEEIDRSGGDRIAPRR